MNHFEIDEQFMKRFPNVEWFDDVTQYQCTRCAKVLVQHYIANCEHKFCSNCKRLLDDGSQRWRCPNCNEFIQEINRQDFQFRERVLALTLKCTNHMYGCDHICRLRDLNEHLKSCKYTRESALPILIKQPEAVLRELSFNLDTLSTNVREINKSVKNLEAEVFVNKNKIDNKISELESKITDLGKAMEENKILLRTENINLEQKVCNLEKAILLKNPQMDCFSLAGDQCSQTPLISWKINGIKNKLRQTTFEATSEAFGWIGYPIRSHAKMEVKKDKIVYMCLCLEGHNEGKPLDIKLIPHVYYVIRDPSGESVPKHRCRSQVSLFGSKFDYSLTFEVPLLEKSWLYLLYNANDSVRIDIYVEPPWMTHMVHSHDGTLRFAIDNYQKRKAMAEEELVETHESPYFYTGPRGYRVRVEMKLGPWLSAQVRFLPGEFDDDLCLPFPHRTTVTLFNRKDPQRDITKTVDQNIQTHKAYTIDMCDDEEIKSVIESDTIFLK